MEDQNSCCGNKSCEDNKAESCGCCSHEKVDVSSLGTEAAELANMFDEINGHLVNALKVRKQILETLHKRASESPEMKEKMEKVLSSRHPVLLQFVLGQQ